MQKKNISMASEKILGLEDNPALYAISKKRKNLAFFTL